MANESSNIHIFPSSNRKVNQSDNYITQNNLTKVVKGMTESDSFVINTEDGNPFRFFIKGYYVEIEDTLRDFTGISSDNPIYATVSITDNYLSGSDSSEDQSSSTQSFITFSNSSGDLQLLTSDDKVPQSSRKINTPVVEAEKVISYDDNNVVSFKVENSSSAVIQRNNGGMNIATNGTVTEGGSTRGAYTTVRAHGTLGGTVIDQRGGRVYIRADKGSSANDNAGAQITLLAKNISDESIDKDKINIDVADGGEINIGNNSNSATISINGNTNISGNNINIKSNNSSGSSIVIGDSSSKSPVNINATTTNIDGNVDINGGTNINGNLIVGTDNNRKTITLKVNSFTATQGYGANNAKIELYNINGYGSINIKAAPYPDGLVTINGTLSTKNISPSGSTYDIGTSNNPFNNGYFNNIPLLNGSGMIGTGDAPLQGYDKTKGTIEERLTNLGFRTATYGVDWEVSGYNNKPSNLELYKQGGVCFLVNTLDSSDGNGRTSISFTYQLSNVNDWVDIIKIYNNSGYTPASDILNPYMCYGVYAENSTEGRYGGIVKYSNTQKYDTSKNKYYTAFQYKDYQYTTPYATNTIRIYNLHLCWRSNLPTE